MLVSLIIGALCIVYALIFCSGTIYQLQKEYDTLRDIEYVEGAKEIYTVSQGVSDTLLILGIIMILAVVLNYITATHKRRNYYITNYVSIAIVTIYALVLAVIMFVLVSNCSSVFYGLDMDAMKADFETENPGLWNYNDWMFSVGYVLAVILILDAIGFVVNLVWKLLLMKGEKKLLENGFVKEAA